MRLDDLMGLSGPTGCNTSMNDFSEVIFIFGSYEILFASLLGDKRFRETKLN